MAKSSTKVRDVVLQVSGLKISYPRGDSASVRNMVKATVEGFIEADRMKEILPHTPQHHRKMTLDQALACIGATKLVK